MEITNPRYAMYHADVKKTFEKPTIEYLRNFILDNQISDLDSIALQPQMFDELALDFRFLYKAPIQVPFIYLGVWIKIADRGTFRPQQAIIVRNDPRPKPEIPKVSYEKVYRCGYCGRLVDGYGAELTGETHGIAIRRWKEYGDGIFIASVGKCCENRKKN